MFVLGVEYLLKAKSGWMGAEAERAGRLRGTDWGGGSSRSKERKGGLNGGHTKLFKPETGF